VSFIFIDEFDSILSLDLFYDFAVAKLGFFVEVVFIFAAVVFNKDTVYNEASALFIAKSLARCSCLPQTKHFQVSV
jgi:hypothetical protein